MIKVLFFAQLAEYAGRSSIELEFQAAMTPRSMVKSMVGVVPKELTDALLHDVAMVAANEVMIAWDDALSDGDEVAFLPPFSGG